MKKKGFPITNIGIISLMMVFIVLCMVTFAALSLSSATGDARSAQKLSEHAKAYYSASNQASEILADIDEIFSDAYKTAKGTDEYYRLISNKLPDSVESVVENGAMELSYQIDLNDNQALQVLISVLPPKQILEGRSSTFYQILSWQEIETNTWEGDETINLFMP